MNKLKAEGRLARNLYATALTAVFVALLVVLNVIVFALTEFYGWYFYVTPQYKHEADGIAASYFDNADNQQVDIFFCMEKDDLEADTVYNLVWQTACQYEKKYSFINIENVNIYLDPQKVNRFKNVYDADGNQIGEQNITRDTVIFSSGDRFTVFRMSDFFFLQEDQRIDAYNGEEFMASGIRYVLDSSRPIVYFTTGHGEQISSAYAQLFVCAGYEMRVIDLSQEENVLDERAEIIVCMNPLYDFEKAAQDSGLHTDIDRLQEFIDNGGNFQLFLDPYVSGLDNLSAFISGYGLCVNQGVILRADDDDAVSLDGYTMMPTYASSVAATEIKALVSTSSSSRLIAREVSPLLLDDKNAQGFTVEALLCAGTASIPYQNGEAVGKADNHPFAALSSKKDGGQVALFSGVFMTAQDILQSDQRANRDFFYSLLEYTEDASTPKGATTLVFQSTLLEDLTIAESNRYARILILWVPLAVTLVGAVIIFKRKRA